MLRVDPLAFLFGAALLLILPLRWLLAAVTAAAMHEACHVALLFLAGGELRGMRIGVGGAVLETALPDTRSELLCAMAGPLGSLLLFFACRRWLPRLALCALAQGLFNLLPLYPLDGGRILRCCLARSPKRKTIETAARWSVALAGAILAVIGAVWFSLGIWPLVLAALQLLRLRGERE